jgi:predicted kinase
MFFAQMAGFPGAGKSTLARAISKQTGAVVIDHDIVKSALLENWDWQTDHKAVGGLSYSIEWAMIDFHLSLGHSVILDSPCFYTATLEKGEGLAMKHQALYKYIECYLPDWSVINDRLKRRERMPSQITHSQSEEGFMRQVENSKRPLDGSALIVDSSQPLDSYLPKVIAYLTA